MSFFFGGGGNKVKPQYTGLQLQTSSSSMAFSLLWGANRLGPNLIWYGDFKTHKKKQKSGKGMGAPKQTTYTYSASLMLALCEGAINSVPRVFRDQEKITSISSIGFSLFTGTIPQAAWGYLVSAHPTEALDYPGVAYLAAANYDLGQSASLPNHSFEVFGRQWSTAKDGSDDADPSTVIDEFLTSNQFGVGMPSSVVDYNSLYSGPNAMTTGDSAYQTYCAAQSFGISPVLAEQKEAAASLDQWTKITNTAIVWTGYILKFIPFDLNPIDGNGYKYRPNVIPVYVLDDDDYVSQTEDPIKISRVDPADAYNALKLTINNRENEYNEAPIEWKDQGLIDQFGFRPAATFAAPEICRLNMGAKVASILGKQYAYKRNEATFLLGPSACLIEPMDLLQAIDPKLGSVLLQVTKVEEDDDYNFQITADQVFAETSGAVGYTPQGIANTPTNTNAPPGPVNTPIIFDVPANLSNGIPEVWAAVSGGNNTLYNQYWGGALVYVSADGGTSFQNIGTVDSPARQGKLTANLPAYATANPDTVNTLAVTLAMSNGELQSVTSSEASRGDTLCYIGGSTPEFLNFEDATLTGAATYDLDDLYRGQYQTAGSMHSTNDPFARLDENIFKYQLPQDYIGQGLKFKFQSFNVWGNAFEDLSSVTVYDYTPTGLGFAIGAPTSCGLAFAARVQADGTNILQGTVTVGPSPGPYLDHYDVQITLDGGASWTDISPVTSNGTTSTFQPALPSTNYRARTRAVSSATGGIPSAWVQSTIVNSGAFSSTVPNQPDNLSGTGVTLANVLEWDAPTGGAIVQGYKIFAIHGSTGSFGSAVQVGSTSGSLTWTHSGLGVSDTWRYWVVAYNFAGNSTEEGPVNVTTDSSGGGGGVDIEDEGTPVATATTLNFTGAGVTATDMGGGVVDITIPGGGGGGAWDFNPPFAADFPTLIGTVTPTLSDDSDVGLIVDMGAAASGDVVRFAVEALPSPGTDFSVICKMVMTAASYNFAGIGMVIGDSVSNRAQLWGLQPDDNNRLIIGNFFVPNTFGGTNPIETNYADRTVWLRIIRVGTTLTFYFSGDGKSWLFAYSASQTSWMSNAPDYIGVGGFYNRTGAIGRVSMSVPYWSQDF